MNPAAAVPAPRVTAATLFPVAVLGLIWGCNWPVLKMGVGEIAPLTFRAVTLPATGLGMLAIARISGDALGVPRALWGRLAWLSLLNIALWNGLLLFGLQQMPAGRSAILGFTMPVWGVLFSLALLREPLSLRKGIGMALGGVGMALLLGEDVRHLRHAPTAGLFILGASVSWALGTVLLRKWRPPLPQNVLTGWMVILGWAPLALLAPFFAPPGPPALPSAAGWFAIFYNIVLAGVFGHWAWFTLARTLPVAVSSMSSLPVPVVGVFAGMLLLGERPGAAEWTALALVVAAMIAVLWSPKAPPSAPAPEA